MDEKPCFAVFMQPKGKNRAIHPPCLDPLDYGEGKEPYPEQLLRRGRVGLFGSREDAETAIKATCEANKGAYFVKNFAFIILECRDHRGATKNQKAPESHAPRIGVDWREMGCSVRLRQSLKRNGITTIREAIQVANGDLRIKGIGIVCRDELRRILKDGRHE